MNVITFTREAYCQAIYCAMLFGKEQAGKGKRYFYEIAAICAENIPGHRLVEGKNLEGKNLIAGYPPPDEHVAPSLDDEPLHTE